MRPATRDDLPAMSAMSIACGGPELAHDLMDRCLGFIGEHGFIIFDMLDQGNCIAHATITKPGRGAWGRELFRSAVRWAFTATRVETIRSMIPRGNDHAIRFGADVGFIEVFATDRFTFTQLDIPRWASMDPHCLIAGDACESDFEFADNEMIHRIDGACVLMVKAGMDGKALYIHNLYAKLFGYKAEV